MKDWKSNGDCGQEYHSYEINQDNGGCWSFHGSLNRIGETWSHCWSNPSRSNIQVPAMPNLILLLITKIIMHIVWWKKKKKVNIVWS